MGLVQKMTNEDCINSHLNHFLNLKDTKKPMDGVQIPKATEPLRGDILLFTSKSRGVNGTRLIYPKRMKGQYILSYFYKPFLGLYHFPEIFPNFLLKLYMSWGKS